MIQAVTTAAAQQVIDFWFTELTAKQWFAKDTELDQQIQSRFSTLLTQVSQGECWQWRQSAPGRLAEIIVLDQFSRNIYRDSAQAFAQDAMALVLAQEAVALQQDKLLPPEQRAFLYMPYMHSESAVIHQQALALFAQPGLENNYAFELKHKDIIDRFGRYPHRNALLGRTSTAAEERFLAQPGSSF
ncbi:DUF924 family protein [Idiomarina xiamenensis]|uniref:DUF924 domain-containing protein n=1 Tax=Idiomarina xiamenensis 10-D-4 TaxID=740709 RepID=K2JJV1_9GAMM|nr:DUF924 family protein [Idiomarina xiamenensis]EKE83686.1 hypothetical protein A10D4_07555 [Idiomarina xiamenensis 10-D-4]